MRTFYVRYAFIGFAVAGVGIPAHAQTPKPDAQAQAALTCFATTALYFKRGANPHDPSTKAFGDEHARLLDAMVRHELQFRVWLKQQSLETKAIIGYLDGRVAELEKDLGTDSARLRAEALKCAE